MDGQHNYEIKLKKDDLFINLSSDDVYFISKQMDKWFRILLDDSYVPVSLPQRPQPVPQAPPPAMVAPPQPVPQPVAEQPAPIPEPVVQPVVQTPEPVMAAAPLPESIPVQQPVPVVEPPVSLPPEPVAQPVPVVELPVSLPPEPVAQPVPAPQPVPEQPIMQPEPQPVAAVAPPPVVDLPPVMQPQPVMAAPPVVPPQMAPAPVLAVVGAESKPRDDFENVMDSVMRDLEAPPEPPRQPVYVAPPVPVQNVLPAEEPPAADLSLISSLSDLCEQAHAGTSEDYLLLASYYLNRMEAQEMFSLKRINSNLVKSGLTPVNHSVLEAVLGKGYLAMVPDMTGTAEVSEYMITPLGLSVVNDLF